MQSNSSTILTVSVQSGRPSSKIFISEEAQGEVRQAYLVSQRQRFKTEINRLTGTDMLQMLKKKSLSDDDAGKLSFLMSYVFAWNWLQNNVNTQYQAVVLDSFCKGPQAFLMKMLLRSNSTAEFIRAYIDYWLQYHGETQVQQNNLLQLLQQKQTAEKLV